MEHRRARRSRYATVGRREDQDEFSNVSADRFKSIRRPEPNMELLFYLLRTCLIEITSVIYCGAAAAYHVHVLIWVYFPSLRLSERVLGSP